MLPSGLENKKEAIQSEVGKLGAELVDICIKKMGGRTSVIIVADKQGGITLEDCARLNGHLSVFLDKLGESEGGFLSTPYTLEVNSPGLDRPLRNQRDFERSVGRTVCVTYQDAAGRVTHDAGEVREVRDGRVFFVRPADRGFFQVSLGEIIKALREIKV